MSDNGELRISTRPSFRTDELTATALALCCAEEIRTPSQVLNLSLRQYLPKKYVEAARARLNKRKRSRKATAK